MKYRAQLQDQFQGQWYDMGGPVDIAGASVPDALRDITSVGLKPGVTYRVHLTGEDGHEITTEPLVTPALPEAARKFHVKGCTCHLPRHV
jgi:hypothetical protein